MPKLPRRRKSPLRSRGSDRTTRERPCTSSLPPSLSLSPTLSSFPPRAEGENDVWPDAFYTSFPDKHKLQRQNLARPLYVPRSNFFVILEAYLTSYLRQLCTIALFPLVLKCTFILIRLRDPGNWLLFRRGGLLEPVIDNFALQ